MQKQLLEGQLVQKDLIAQYDPETAQRYEEFCLLNGTLPGLHRKRQEYLEKRCEVCDRIIGRNGQKPSQYNRLHACSEKCSYELRSRSRQSNKLINGFLRLN